MELQRHIGKVGIMVPAVDERWKETGVPSLLRGMQAKRMFLQSSLAKLFLHLTNVCSLSSSYSIGDHLSQARMVNTVVDVKIHPLRQLH